MPFRIACGYWAPVTTFQPDAQALTKYIAWLKRETEIAESALASMKRETPAKPVKPVEYTAQWRIEKPKRIKGKPTWTTSTVSITPTTVAEIKPVKKAAKKRGKKKA